MLRHRLFLFLAVASAGLIAACGGGGGSSSPIPSGGTTNYTKSTGATVQVLIPKSSASSSSRKPAFISSNTATITIGVYTVNGATPSPTTAPTSITIATSSDCTTVSGGTSCTITVTVPVATSVVLQISSYDGSGNLLGQGLIGPINTTLATIPMQSVSVGGVPATFVLEPTALSAGDDGLTHPLTLTVFAKDASGNFILQPGNYPNPITLSISGDPNGALLLSTTSIPSPGPSPGGATTVTVDYNSARAITQATITASSGSVTASVPFAPIVYSPTTVSLYVGGPMQTVTLSEAGYGGAFSTPGPSTVASITCVPANCTPSSVGGSITLDIAPGSSVGNENFSPVDSNGGFANIPITLTSSSGGGELVAPQYSIYEYKTQSGGTNYGIAVGPDGQTIWFVDQANAGLGSVTSPAGCTTSCGTIGVQSPFVIASGPPAPVGLQAITAASDGNLYVTDVGNVGNGNTDFGTAYQVSCSAAVCNQATMINDFPEPTPAPGDVLAAPDGNIYFSSQYDNPYGGSIFDSTIVSCCSFNSLYVATSGPSSVNGMTVDSSGQTLWFTDSASGNVGFFPIPCGGGCSITELPSGAPTCQECGARHRPLAVHRAAAPSPRRHRSQCCGNPFAALNGIVAAPDGNLYVAEAGANVIDQLNPTTWEQCIGESCVYTPIALPNANALPQNLTIGRDGNVWFTDTTGYVGFISLSTCASGTCKAFEYHVGGSPWGITSGPDGNIWFTDSSTNAIGKVVL